MKTVPPNSIVRNPNRTLGMWILMGYGVYFVVILGFAMLSFISSLISLTYRPSFMMSDPLRSNVLTVAMLIAMAVVIGWSVGFLQKLVIEQRLGWGAEGWVFGSVVGAILGLLGLIAFVMLFPRFTAQNGPAYLMPLFITPVAMCQWRVLRRAVNQAHLWVLANIAAGLSYALIPVVFASEPLLIVLLAPLAQSALTGMMLIWLFERYRIHNRPAVAPVVARAKHAPSVWDEAI
ncbi:hypothetical protein VZO05_00830 [Aggregatilineales bacterium SYSU G02658]